jgi:hypothetical protein
VDGMPRANRLTPRPAAITRRQWFLTSPRCPISSAPVGDFVLDVGGSTARCLLTCGCYRHTRK